MPKFKDPHFAWSRLPTKEPLLAKTDVSTMAEQALDQIAQIVEKGSFQTPKGKVVTLDPDQHIRVLTWAAMQREKKPKVLDSPDDLQLRETAH